MGGRFLVVRIEPSLPVIHSSSDEVREFGWSSDSMRYVCWSDLPLHSEVQAFPRSHFATRSISRADGSAIINCRYRGAFISDLGIHLP
jgi:hypothetical protein